MVDTLQSLRSLVEVVRETNIVDPDGGPIIPASDVVQWAANEITRLREAMRCLAAQDATLSVCDGHVTVTMDAPITDNERAAIQRAVSMLGFAAANRKEIHSAGYLAEDAATLRGLLERMK